MNQITVTAHGSPGSFVRRVQENPQIAVELRLAVRAQQKAIDGLIQDLRSYNLGYKASDDIKQAMEKAVTALAAAVDCENVVWEAAPPAT